MRIKDPVFIIGCPRSGTSLLFAILRNSDKLWSSYRESHYLWEKFLPDKRDPIFSMYLDENDFKAEDKKYLESQFHKYTYNSEFIADILRYIFLSNTLQAYMRPIFSKVSNLTTWIKSLFLKDYRVIDKTPPNTYRVSYIAKAFPDAKFIYITREGKTNISSLMEGWLADRRFNFKFRSFYEYNKRLNIKGYPGKVWKFTNPPGWEEYLNRPLEEVCAFQWLSAHKYAMQSFNKLDSSRWVQVKYEDLIANPQKIIRELCMFIDVPYEGKLESSSEALPVVSTDSKPDSEKWKKNADRLANIEGMIAETQEKLGYQQAIHPQAHG